MLALGSGSVTWITHDMEQNEAVRLLNSLDGLLHRVVRRTTHRNAANCADVEAHSPIGVLGPGWNEFWVINIEEQSGTLCGRGAH